MRLGGRIALFCRRCRPLKYSAGISVLSRLAKPENPIFLCGLRFLHRYQLAAVRRTGCRHARLIPGARNKTKAAGILCKNALHSILFKQVNRQAAKHDKRSLFYPAPFFTAGPD